MNLLRRYFASIAPLVATFCGVTLALIASNAVAQPFTEGFRPAGSFSEFEDEQQSQDQELPAPKAGQAKDNTPNPAPELAEEVEPASPSDAPTVDQSATTLVLAPPLKIWSGNVELGINGTEGNTETFNIRAGGKAVGKYAWSTQTYESIFVENTTSGLATARNAIGDARWEIPLWTPNWSYYAHGRLEYDEFKPFDLRVAGDTGLGYDWLKTDINAFQTRAGISTSREFGGAEDFWKPELAFGLEWRRTIDARQKITIKSDYFPTWDDFSDYRLNTQADWEFAIQPAWNLSLKLSAISRYDATPNGANPHDLNYAALLLWNY
jgi:hypothetical protein